MSHKIYTIFIIAINLYSLLGIISIFIVTKFFPNAILTLCVLAWVSLFGVASFLKMIYYTFNAKAVDMQNPETIEDICNNFQAYKSKTFWAIVGSSNNLSLQPVRLLYIAPSDTVRIFYFNDKDCVFLETKVNVEMHNLWTTKTAAQAELCRRNPNVTLEDLNYDKPKT